MDDSAGKGEACSIEEVSGKRGGDEKQSTGKGVGRERTEECCNCGKGGKATERSNGELPLQ